MKRFLRDAAIALFVGAVLIALAMFLKQPDHESPAGPGPAPAQEATEQ